MRIRRLRGTKQAQPHRAAGRRKAVFAIVEDREAVVGIAEVGKAMAADLEFRHIPRRVVVGGPADETVLRLVRGFGVADRGGELDFEEFHRLVPLDLCADGDGAGASVPCRVAAEGFGGELDGVEGDGGADPTLVADLGFSGDGDAIRPCVDDLAFPAT